MVLEYQNDQWSDIYKYSCCVGKERYSYSDCPKYYNYTQQMHKQTKELYTLKMCQKKELAIMQ